MDQELEGISSAGILDLRLAIASRDIESSLDEPVGKR